MAIFPPAVSGTSGSNYNPRNTSMYSPQGHFLGAPVVIIFAFLDLEKTMSFLNSLLVGELDHVPGSFEVPKREEEKYIMQIQRKPYFIQFSHHLKLVISPLGELFQ